MPSTFGKAGRRIREMRGLYSNWPFAVASRAGLHRRSRPSLLRLRVDGRILPVLADLAQQDVRVINEIWLERPYLRNLPAKPHPVVLDIGANKGYFAVFALAILKARVYAYEPHPDNLKYLRANVALHGGLAAVHDAAVTANYEPSIELHYGVSPWLHTVVPPSEGEVVGLHRMRYTDESSVVPAVHIADAIEEALLATGRIDLLKTDTEGADLELLCAIPPTQLKRIRNIATELSGGDPLPAMQYLSVNGFGVELDGAMLRASRVSTPSWS